MENSDFYTKEGERINLFPELKEMLKSEEVYDIFVEKQFIKMVGIYRFGNGSVWYSFPKYSNYSSEHGIPNESDMSSLKKIVNVLDKLRKEKKNVFEGEAIFDENKRNSSYRKVSMIELSRYLVKDYLQHGIYRRNEKISSIRNQGKISWARTIHKEKPLLSGNSVIYDKTWKVATRLDDTNAISKLHASIIYEAMELLENVGDSLHCSKPEIEYLYSEKQKLESCHLFSKELMYLFNDRDISLMKALIAWCDLSVYYRFSGCTNCFHNVWEWVNDFVFGNQRKDSNKNSGNPYYYLGSKDSNLEVYEGKGNAKPDTIYFAKLDDGTYRLCIYDSKYYIPTFKVDQSKNEIFGYPANADIVKQVAYEKFVITSFGHMKDKTKVSNIFLMPEIPDDMLLAGEIEKVEGKLFSEIGYVVPANFDYMVDNLLGDEQERIEINRASTNDNKIIIYMVNSNILFDMYLKNQSYEP